MSVTRGQVGERDDRGRWVGSGPPVDPGRPLGGAEQAESRPWRFQAGRESLSSYRYFVEFLRLGPGRTLRALADATGGKLTYLYNLSARNNWQARSAGFDAHKTRQETWRLEQARDRAAAHQTRAFEIISEAILNGAKGLLEASKQPGFLFTPKQLQEFVDILKLSRVDSGGVSDRTAHDVGGSAREMILQTLAEYRERAEERAEQNAAGPAEEGQE